MKLSDYMDYKNLSDDDMASMVDAHRSTISRVRRGKARPSWALASNIQKVTEGMVTVNDFI